jgi:hypothetical protein
VLRRACAALTVVLGPLLVLDGACARANETRVGAPVRATHAVGRDAAAAAMPAPGIPQVLPPQGLPSDSALNLTEQQACALPTTADPVPALAQASPFVSLEGTCVDPFCVSVDAPPEGAGACYVANDNLRRAEQKARAASSKGTKRSHAWDGVSSPQYLGRIDAHLHLTPAEHALLRKNGFVVLDRLAYVSYAAAFHDIFQEQLPLYVSVDPIFHAVFRGTELVLAKLEREQLEPALRKLLTALRKTLLGSRGRYDETTLADLDVYLGMAKALLDRGIESDRAPSLFGHEDAVIELLTAAERRELEAVELFGRKRMVDFSQLEPRGHYAAADVDWPTAGTYFQAMTWLSRLEFNLVSRGSKSSHPGTAPDRGETPREARDALALADLVERAGVLPELASFEAVYTAFAGRREDVAIPDLLRLMRRGRFSARHRLAPEKLKAAIGSDFRRTARFHFMPQDSGELPAIATLFGPRITPDVAPLMRLVHDKTSGRLALGAADLAYTLGHDRAEQALERERKSHPGLGAELAGARADLLLHARGGDVYAAWLRAILALAQVPDGRAPSFFGRDAHADAKINSTLSAYAQLRHTFVLMAAQGYDAYGCEIPDAYVEPHAAVYDALIAHVAGLRRVSGGGFAGLDRTLQALRAVVATELVAGLPSKEQRDWLAMVAEHLPRGGLGGDSGEPPKWTGWYFDMFENRHRGANRTSALIADYFTLTNIEQVAYVGIEGPRLAVFVVDSGESAKAMVGPVAKAYETLAPIAGRLDDAAARTHAKKSAFWRASFAAPAIEEPALGLMGELFYCPRGTGVEARVVVKSERDVGSVSIALLDHHADPLTPVQSLEVRPGTTVFPFALPQALAGVHNPVEGVNVRVADLARSGAGQGSYVLATTPSVFCCEGDQDDVQGLPVRPRGTSFKIGAR